MTICSIVLAAGKGTRMKSSLPKVLHPVFFTPMICHVLDCLDELSLSQNIVVTGHEHQRVEECIGDYKISFVFQEHQNGTGHAVQLCEQKVHADINHVLVVCGDTPLITAATLQDMINTHLESGSDVTVLSTMVDDPTNYGRIVCDSEGTLLAIIEEKDATPSEKSIKEINAGIYIVKRDVLFSSLKQIDSTNAQGELYLTDIISIASQDNYLVTRVICDNSQEVMGVNSRNQLVQAHDIKQKAFFEQLLDDGVTVIRRSTSSIHPTAIIGQDTTISSNVSIDLNCVIGSFCQIDDQCYLKKSYIGDNAVIGAGSKLIGATIPANSIVAPASVVIFENDIEIE